MRGLLIFGSVAIFIIAALIMWKNRPERAVAGTTSPAKMYLRLRDAALHINPKAAGAPLDIKGDEPFAVVTDWSFPNDAVATIFATLDGSASIYYSTGSGAIGGEGVQQIRLAARKCVVVAGEMRGQFSPTTEFPIAKTGQVRFYLVSRNGVTTASISETDLDKIFEPLKKLFAAVQDIVTAYRLSGESRTNAGP
jgi:hypothetical protein